MKAFGVLVDRNVTGLSVAILTGMSLYFNWLNFIIGLIAVANIVDLFDGITIGYFIHHIITIFAAWQWWEIDAMTKILIADPVWYLLLHELSTIPFTLIYLLKPFRYYHYIEIPLKMWFALSFICIRSFSIGASLYSVRLHRQQFYTVIGVLGVLDGVWGCMIIKKMLKHFA